MRTSRNARKGMVVTSPWNELIEFGKHLIDFDPILQIFGGAHVSPFIDHNPAHMRCTVFAG
jgi:hypothetical protein